MKQIDGWNVPEYTHVLIKAKQDAECVVLRSFGACEKVECITCIFDSSIDENTDAFKKWLKEQGECL